MTAPAVAAPVAAPVSANDRIAPISALADQIVGRGLNLEDAAPPPDPETPTAAPTDEAAPEAASVVSGDTTPAPEGDTPPESTPEAPAVNYEAGQDVGTGDALFRVRDPATGQFVAPPNQTVELAIRDKATGEVKVYQKSVAELARMARDGIAGQRILAEHQQVTAELPQMRQQLAETTQRAEQFGALLEQVLSDTSGAAWQRLAEQFQQERAPEKVAAREQEVVARERDTTKQQLHALRAQMFAETRLMPVIRDLEAQLGQEVVAGKLLIDTGGMTNVPPEQWDALAAYVNGPLKQWGAQQLAARSGATQQAREAAKTQQAAVNRQAAPAKPLGVGIAPAPAAQPKPKNTQEIADAIVMGRLR